MGHRGNRCGFKQLGFIFKPTMHAVRPFAHFQRQIKRRQSSRDFFSNQRETLQTLMGRPGVLENEHHLEDRWLGQGSFGLQLLDQSFEWHILMRVCSERYIAYPSQQLAEGGIT